jgi:surface polysaccharide O-acyltransferase-like enzyme
MSEHGRLVHVDGLRGLAVVLMVLVHAAATWEPNLTGTWLVLGVFVSAAGGLAAPLFVALFGWGIAQKKLSRAKRYWRAGFLFLCQLVINLSAPHLFEPWTPGVLSLMGILILLEPLWRTVQHRWKEPSRVFLFGFTLILSLTFLFGSWQGPSQWDPRVSTETPSVLLHHLMLTGLYPVFPWVVFAWFGFTVSSFQEDAQRRAWFRSLATMGLVISVVFLVQSLREGRTWALPAGDAVLTFFPANAAFLVAAITGLTLLWWGAERLIPVHRLADLGRASLTVYVLHFLPFALFHSYEDLHQWSASFTGLVVLCYTTTWVFVGTLLHRKASSFTLEALMRRFEPS